MTRKESTKKTPDGKTKKKLYKQWWFWVIIAAVVIISLVLYKPKEDNNENKDATKETTSNVSTKQSQPEKKWSEMTLSEKEGIAADLCQDATLYSGKINLNQYDIISLAHLWDSWDIYTDKNAVIDGVKVSTTSDGLPIYMYNWNGNYKATNSSPKEVAKFSCSFSVDENNGNATKILWLTVDGVNIIGDQSLVFQDNN